MTHIPHNRSDRPPDWESFVDALQVLVLVAGDAVKRLKASDPADACREVVTATTHVLELTQRVLPQATERNVHTLDVRHDNGDR